MQEEPNLQMAPVHDGLNGAKVTIVDACPARALGIATALAKDDFEIEVLHNEAAIRADCDADVIVLSLRDAADVRDVAARVLVSCGPRVALVALVPDSSPATFRSAFRGGATGAVHADAHLDLIRECVRLAAQRRTVLPTHVVHGLVSGRSGSDLAVETKEAAWLQALADGNTVAELARRESFSEREMHRLLRRLYERLGVRTRARALLLALQEGVIT